MTSGIWFNKRKWVENGEVDVEGDAVEDVDEQDEVVVHYVEQLKQ